MKIQPFKMTVTNEQSLNVQRILAGFGIGWRGKTVGAFQNIGDRHHLLFDGICLTWSSDRFDIFDKYDQPKLTYGEFIEITSTLNQFTDVIEKYLMMNEPEVYKRTKRSDIKDWLILNS